MPTNMASVYGRIGLRTDALTLSSVILPKSRFWKVVVRIRLLRIRSHAMEKVSFCKSLKIRMLVSDRHGAKTNGSERLVKHYIYGTHPSGGMGIGCDGGGSHRMR